MSEYNELGNGTAVAVIYVRVSPGKGQAAKADEPDGYSIPAQLEACKRKAHSLGAIVVEEFVERSESAKTSDRPELQRMMIYVREEHVKYVIVHKGVLYPGKHEPLIDQETWQRVQELLTARNISGERRRDHEHYLKGSIFCGQCGSRLIVTHAKGRGGTYPYFICIGRQEKRTACKQRALRIELVEEAIVKHYATVELPADELTSLRAMLEEDLTKLRLDGERERQTQTRRVHNVEAERQSCLLPTLPMPFRSISSRANKRD